MKFSNPYAWKHYKLLVVIPLVLIIASLFFIPNIPRGVDLKGGLLLTVYTQESVNSEDVKAQLGDLAASADVRVFESPAGKGVEISLPLDEKLQGAEDGLKRVRELDAALVAAEISASSGENASNVEQLHADLNAEIVKVLSFCGSSASVPSDSRAAVELAEQTFSDAKSSYRDEILAAVSKVAVVKDYSFKEIGSSLSQFFVNKTQEMVIWSFVLSAIVIFVVLRSIVPSFTVLFGAFADIVITMGVMGILQIPLSLASISALLMLIGFSLDTDILLAVRLLKRKEGLARDRVFEAMGTGMLMDATTVAAFGVLTIIAILLQIPFYYQIGAVAVIGSLVDFIATWCFNAPLLLWHVEKKEKASV